MNSIIKVLMERDNLSLSEANDVYNEGFHCIQDAIEDGEGYNEVEELMLDFFGLEMDYIFDIL